MSGEGAVPAPGCTGQQVGPGLPEPLLGSVWLILGAVGTFSKSSVNLGQPTPMIRGCSGPSRGLAWPSGSGKQAADSEQVLVPSEAAELFPQPFVAGPLLGVPVPAREHQLVCVVGGHSRGQGMR